MNSITLYEGVLLLIYVAIIFIYAMIFLPGTVLKKIFVSVFDLACMISVSNLWTSLVTTVGGIEIEKLLSEPSFVRFLTIILVQASYVFLFHLLIQIFGKGNVRLRKLEWLLLLTVFFFSSTVIVCIQISSIQENLHQSTHSLLLYAEIAIVIINLVTIELISLLNRQYQEKIETQRSQSQLQYQTQYATTVQQQEEIVHKLRHDMKHSMAVLKELAEEENTEKIKQYLEQYAEQLHAMISFVRTDNVCVDAIINTKLTYAQEIGIDVVSRIDANLPKLREIDYCTLLGNLLDNAIEASKNSLVQPEIIVEMRSTDDKLTVCVKNRIDTSVLSKNPKLKTSKNDPNEHGFGITTIREIAEKYDGTADFYEDNGYFIAQIVLYTVSATADQRIIDHKHKSVLHKRVDMTGCSFSKDSLLFYLSHIYVTSQQTNIYRS